MKFAAVQLQSQAALEENLVATQTQVEAAARAGAEVILLPEGFAYLGPEEGKRSLAEELPGRGPIALALSSWSRRLGVAVIAGGLPERSESPDRPYNTSAVYVGGELLSRYRKMHLFDVDLPEGPRLCESGATTAGNSPQVVHLGELGVGLAICYDLRFPELFAWEVVEGAQVLTLPAAFTETTGRAHWEVLLRARAIECQCWVVAAGQQGTHPGGRRTWGHSMIVDPWGTVVAELPEGPGFVLSDLTLESVQRLRTSMPLARHRQKSGL